MKLRFTQRASQDISEIADYVRAKIHRQQNVSALPFSMRCKASFSFRVSGAAKRLSRSVRSSRENMDI
jgi:hypothetical protein